MYTTMKLWNSFHFYMNFSWDKFCPTTFQKGCPNDILIKIKFPLITNTLNMKFWKSFIKILLNCIQAWHSHKEVTRLTIKQLMKFILYHNSWGKCGESVGEWHCRDQMWRLIKYRGWSSVIGCMVQKQPSNL